MTRVLSLHQRGLATLLLVGITSALHAQNITTFDVPNSTLTHPLGINSNGKITGYFTDTNNVKHAFLRERDGAVITFDIPDAIDSDYCPGYISRTTGTSAVAINPAGQIAGAYTSLDYTPEGTVVGCPRSRGFLRRADGTLTTFDIPFQEGSDESVYWVTPKAINPSGQIAGLYIFSDVPSPTGGFLRQPDGTIITIDVDGYDFHTEATAINPAGQIAGVHVNPSDTTTGFLMQPDGTFTKFGVPGSTYTYPTAINPRGEIAGWYSDASYLDHGFLRLPDGSITTFDVPNASGTVATAMNHKGQITGFYLDASQVYHGFLRQSDGTMTTFDVPNSTYTGPTAINSKGQVTGWYSDASNGVHGFVREK
jgi:probable HAF family extracellular repeat protein